MDNNDKRAKPSPGPWITSANGDHVYTASLVTQHIATVAHNKQSRTPEAQANAHLIAASWEMGQLLLWAYGHWEMPDNKRAEIKAVLKKAGLLR